LDENRRIAHNLRPTELDNLGLAAACSSFCNEIQLRTNLKFQCRLIAASQRLPLAVELNLFRIVQEAVNNVEKYARAKSVKLGIRIGEDSAVLKIQDDGQGFDAKTLKPGGKKHHGLGLTNMRERALFLGGNCEIESLPGRGTTITVRVPLKNSKKGPRRKRELLTS